MQTYIAVLMTFSGLIGFGLYANAEDAEDRAVAVTALKVASALLTALTAMVVSGYG